MLNYSRYARDNRRLSLQCCTLGQWATVTRRSLTRLSRWWTTRCRDESGAGGTCVTWLASRYPNWDNIFQMCHLVIQTAGKTKSLSRQLVFWIRLSRALGTSREILRCPGSSRRLESTSSRHHLTLCERPRVNLLVGSRLTRTFLCESVSAMDLQSRTDLLRLQCDSFQLC